MSDKCHRWWSMAAAEVRSTRLLLFTRCRLWPAAAQFKEALKGGRAAASQAFYDFTVGRKRRRRGVAPSSSVVCQLPPAAQPPPFHARWYLCLPQVGKKADNKKSWADSGSSSQIMCTRIPPGHEPAATLEQSEPKHKTADLHSSSFFFFKSIFFGDRLPPHTGTQLVKGRIKKRKEASSSMILLNCLWSAWTN